MSMLKTRGIIRGGLFLTRNTNDSIILNTYNKQLLTSTNLQMLSSRLFKVAASAAVLSGSYYGATSYMRYRHSIRSMSGIQLHNDTMQLSAMPQVKPTSVVPGPTKLNFDITLFQYCSCPFCCKTRTFLDYFGVNYNIVEVNPVMRQQLKWSKDYRKVPILLAHTKPDAKEQKVFQINDSSVIVSTLSSFLMSKRNISDPDGSTSPTTIDDLGRILVNYQTIELEETDGTVKKEIPNRYFLMLGDIKELELQKREVNLAEERYWRDWSDRVLVHSLSPNIYRTIPEAIQAFRNFSAMGDWERHFSLFERMTAIYAGSAVMWLVGKRLKKRHNLKGDIRESLYDNCRQWTNAIGKDRSFMGGEKPNLADLSVFGVLRSIEGCTAFNDLVEKTNIKPWYYAVKECCEKHRGRELIRSI